MADDDDDDDEDSSDAPFKDSAVVVPRRRLLYQPPDARVCYFYRDGAVGAAAAGPPVKLVVSRRAYPSLDRLKAELTRRVDGLGFPGVRGIFTPAGRDVVRSLNDLRHDGRYVCTTGSRARGVDHVCAAGSRARRVDRPTRL